MSLGQNRGKKKSDEIKKHETTAVKIVCFAKVEREMRLSKEDGKRLRKKNEDTDTDTHTPMDKKLCKLQMSSF